MLVSAALMLTHRPGLAGRSFSRAQAKTTKKIVLRLQCNVCKTVNMHAIKVCVNGCRVLKKGWGGSHEKIGRWKLQSLARRVDGCSNRAAIAR